MDDAGEDLCLRDVRGEHLGHGQQLFGQSLHGVVPQQLGAGGGHHHGVHHDMLCIVSLELFGNDADQLRRGHHADLDGIGVDIGEDGVDLLAKELRGGLKDIGDAGGVLGREGGDGAHGKHAVHRHGFDVGLNSGAAAGVTASDCQCCSHVFPPVARIGRGSASGKNIRRARWCPQCTTHQQR